MNYLKALGIKFIYVSLITFSLFGMFDGVSLYLLLLMSVIITGVTFLGDTFLLPRLGSVLAVIGDFGLAFLIYAGLGSVLIETFMPIILISLGASFFFAISESIFHIYMNEQVFGVEPESRVPMDLQTEFAEETDDKTLTKNIQNEKDK